MRVTKTLDIEVSGIFVYMNGEMVKPLIFKVSDLEGLFPLNLKDVDSVLFTLTELFRKPPYTFSLIVLSPKTIGGFYAKTIPHRAMHEEFVQLIYGRGAIQSVYLNTDLSVSVKTAKLDAYETAKVDKDSHYLLYNFGTSNAVFLLKHTQPWRNSSFIHKNEGEPFFFKANGEYVKNTNYLVSNISDFKPYHKSIVDELEVL